MPTLRSLLAAAALATVTVLAGCGTDVQGQDGASAAKPATTSQDGGGQPPAASSGALPVGHVHGIARDPGNGDLYLATHHGLFVYGKAGEPVRVGPVIDLMGFTVAGPGRLLASGHPGEGTDLPQPVGLIESTDGGRTWAVRSRGGRSDFHALTASRHGVLGFDGTLRRSTDGETWQDLDSPGEVIAVAAAPDGRTVLVTTDAGLQSSTTQGSDWGPVPGAPPVVLLAWTDNQRVVGVDPAGAVFLSADAGRRWQRAGAAPLGQPQAVGAAVVAGELEIFVVTREAIQRSTDGGATFSPDL